MSMRRKTVKTETAQKALPTNPAAAGTPDAQAAERFLRLMSHEMRTPLNGVMGLAQALEATPLDEAQRAILAELSASGARLESLVAGLLQYELGPAPAPQGSAEAVSPDGGLRVLLADDNPTNRKVVELMLDAAEIEVISVENGAEAVAALEGGAFDLVLMDLRMPVMDGFEAIKAIRAAEPPGQRLPIIVVSANAGPEDREASAAAGADRHIAKPIRAETLFGAIAEVLNG